MKTINIKGKEYVMVVDRVKEFHIQYPDGDISTEIVSDNGTRVVVKAVVSTTTKKAEADMYRQFTGHSQAEWGKGMMGDVALEIAETSAIGRALGFANIGLLDGIASADEIRKVGKKVYQEKNKQDKDNDVDPLQDNEDEI